MNRDAQLTFGDGFNPDDVDRFLEILDDNGVKAENINAEFAGE